jgi:hypothetical protein
MAQTRRLCALFVLLFIFSPLLLARLRVDAAPPSASASAAAPAPASATPASCVFSTPAGTFDLAPLGAVRADSPQDGGAGWSALFGACADLDASAAEGLCGSAARPRRQGQVQQAVVFCAAHKARHVAGKRSLLGGQGANLLDGERKADALGGFHEAG